MYPTLHILKTINLLQELLIQAQRDCPYSKIEKFIEACVSLSLSVCVGACLCARPSGRLGETTRPYIQMCHAHTQTHTDLPAWPVWGMFLLWMDLWWQAEGNETLRDIYCQCQSLLSQRGKWGQLEILAENRVLSLVWKEKNTVFSLCHQSSKISNSEVSVEASNINKEGINEKPVVLIILP